MPDTISTDRIDPFSPWKLRTLELPNRFIKAATFEGHCKGGKPDKAQQVAWLYTQQKIDAWIAAQHPITIPAIMTSEREPGQTLIRDSFPQG